MDLQTAVALSMLHGVPRGRVAETLRADIPRDGPRPGAGRQLIARLAGEARSDPNPAEAAARVWELAAQAIHEGERAGLRAVPWGTVSYPPRLATIFDPPPVLWVAGNPDVLAEPAVAMVGSRTATPYALEVGRHLGLELARRGIVVVSGLARGVDSATHRGALDAGGCTMAILGSGADVIYPAEHRALARDIVRGGAIASELPPGTPPRRHHFPLRNRLISGVSLAVVVIEASERSGSLITACAALEQGREVMVVPGSVLSGRNRGSHALLRDGAKIVESVDDILEDLQFAPGSGSTSLPLAQGRTDPILGAMTPGESVPARRSRRCGGPRSGRVAAAFARARAGRYAHPDPGRAVCPLAWTGPALIR